MAHTTLENRFFFCSWTGLITDALTQNDSEPKSIQFCGLVSSDEASWQTPTTWEGRSESKTITEIQQKHERDSDMLNPFRMFDVLLLSSDSCD